MFVHDHLNLGFVMSLSIDVYVWRVYCYVIFVSVCVYTEVLCQGDRTTFDVHIWWHLLVSQAERLKMGQQNTIVNQTISWTKSFSVFTIVFEATSLLTTLAMDMLTLLTLTLMVLNMLTSGRDKNCGDEEKRAKGGESRTTTRTTRKQANKATFRALELSVYGLLVLSLSSKLIAGPSTR